MKCKEGEELFLCTVVEQFVCLCVLYVITELIYFL